MKKICALLLAAMLVMGCLPAIAEATEMGETVFPDHLVVGNPTPMRGEFFTELWGNATSDIDVRDLLHAYNLIYWDGENGMFTFDPTVVSAVETMVDEAGNKTYSITLMNDLYYSNGTRITAWDYAFSYLFTIAPELAEIGATPLRREQFLGYEEYISRPMSVEPRVLSGVKVLSDLTFSVTLRHEFLPFFYELGLLLCNPYPISVIAPGVTVRDDGNGVYLANEDPSVLEPLFTADLLEETVMDDDDGYLSHPSVVSGPYTLLSWDGVTAEFEINPFFKGNTRGLMPRIRHLTYTLAENDTMIEKLEAGEFGLLNKVMRADRITAGIGLMNEGGISFSNYPRVGLSYISFCCEKETVESLAVRQAIAYCMDRDQVTADYTGAFGQRVDGWYGVGQWMYGVVMGNTTPPIAAPEDENDAAAMRAYEVELAAFENLSLEGLNPYGVNIDRANALLNGDGWVLNEEGLREKDGVVLDLKMIYPEGNNIPASMQTNLVDNLAQVGIRLTMEAEPMQELLTEWYKQDDRDVDMIYLATNFYLVFDPSVHFLTNEDGTHDWSYTNLHDEKLYGEAEAMRMTEPGDVLTYLQHWISFQERFNEILPMLPVYSNIYFDFYTDTLQDYYIAENITWGQAIVGAWLGEAPEEEAAPAEAGTEGGIEIIE